MHSMYAHYEHIEQAQRPKRLIRTKSWDKLAGDSEGTVLTRKKTAIPIYSEGPLRLDSRHMSDSLELPSCCERPSSHRYWKGASLPYLC